MLSVFQQGEITFARGMLGSGFVFAAYHPRAGLKVGTPTLQMTLRQWRPGIVCGDFIARRVGHAITWHHEPDDWIDHILDGLGPDRSRNMLWPCRIEGRSAFGLFHYENTAEVRDPAPSPIVEAIGLDKFKITRDADNVVDRLYQGHPVDAILEGRKGTPIDLRIDLSRKETS